MGKKIKRPDVTIKEARSQSVTGRHYKQTTTLKAAAAEGVESPVTTLTPSDEQLEKINQYTRSEKSANDVVAYTTLSCNDVVDRQDEFFSKQAIDDFAAMAEPYSSLGKPYMVSHNRSSLPVGRIFDVGTKQVDDYYFLTNDVYIPKTASNASFIENLDFGVYNAVSVSVAMAKSTCSIDGSDMSYFFGWGFCQEGHIKGDYYDPDNHELDDFGYIEPADQEDAKAVKATAQLDSPVDFYELSQVFLGAQFFAELEKESSFTGVLKAASADHPFVSLTDAQKSSLHIPGPDERLAEARQELLVERNADGAETWTDKAGLIWEFSNGSILCLGKAQKESDTEEEPDVDLPDADLTVQADDGEEEQDGEAPDDDAEIESEDESVEESNDESSRRRNNRTLALGGVSEATIKAIKEDGFVKTIIAINTEAKALSEKLKEAEPMAELGRQYVVDLKASAIDWYVKSIVDPKNPKAVDVAPVEKLLANCNDNIDLIKTFIDLYKSAATSKLPTIVRRSTEPTNPNVRSLADEPVEPQPDNRVARLHG